MRSKAFTLIELLVVMAILGILASVALVSFRSSQARSRDTQRKSDLRQVASALELYYSDYRKYPDSPLPWGSEFKDANGTIYFKQMPTDPSSFEYFYEVDLTNQKFRLFAHLENSQDKNLISGLSQSCGGAACNFAITSPNTTATETW